MKEPMHCIIGSSLGSLDPNLSCTFGAQAWTTACYGASRPISAGAQAASRLLTSWAPASTTRAATGSRSPRLCALVALMRDAQVLRGPGTRAVLLIG